ncbi:glycoside hydrolase family protein [Xylophilus sp.]|uniref:glycoside hydrolase family protein n=1 Tax=Xylophilus sp. TaxID=2653893 RepID=UPI0013B70A6B|nr:glycoside hydrolase family protein [Xylophilus sp.]KAF1049326.1 MAG: hypothetical protein GAK38_00782 [Xylophilus sp.]
MTPDPTNPDYLEHQAIQAQIDKLTMQGELRMDSTVGPAGSASYVPKSWNLDAYRDFLARNRATMPQMNGALPTGTKSILDLAKSTIDGAEGFYPTAYYGSKNPKRTDPKNITVRPGDFDDNAPAQASNEVAIGYGFNLNAHKNWRSLFSQMFGFTDADNHAIANGQKGLTQEQGGQLRDHLILQFNADIDRMLPGTVLNDGERAALISLAYNAGAGGLRRSGIPDAIQRGAKPQEVAQMIRSFNTLGGQLQNRRNHEAAVYLGAKAQAFFDNGSNRLPPQ